MTSDVINKFIEYYQNLLIIQYHNKPNARAVIRAFLRPLAEVFELLEELENAFNIETAVGVQLDIVAKYFGVRRTYNNIVFDRLYHNYQYINGYEDGLSFQTLNNQGEGGTWTLQTANSSYYDLTDKELRQLIKLRIIGLNNELITYEFLDSKVFDLFGSELLTMQGPIYSPDMNVGFFFDDSTNIGKVLHNYPEYYPVPAGVGGDDNPLPAKNPYFTLTKLQINGGLAYNYFQASFSVLGKQQGGRIRLVNSY